MPRAFFYAEGLSDVCGAIMSIILFLFLFNSFLNKRKELANKVVSDNGVEDKEVLSELQLKDEEN